MKPATDIYEAIATRLHTKGAAVWNPTGIYTPTQCGIILKKMPASPDNAVVLTIYDRPTSMSRRTREDTIRLQIRARTSKGRPDSVDTLAENITTALEGDHQTWSNILFAHIRRISYLPLGFDANDRPEISMNFELILPH